MRILPRLPRSSRATLLQQFAVASFIVLLVLGVGLSVFLGRAIQNSGLAQARQEAVDSLNGRLMSQLHRSDLTRPTTVAQQKQFRWFINTMIKSKRTVRVKVWNARGIVVFSDDIALSGRRFPIDSDLQSALNGRLATDVSTLSNSENLDERGLFGKLMQVYIPIRFPGDVRPVGAFEIYQTYGPVQTEITNLQRGVYLMVGIGFLLLYGLLFGVVRNGSRTITRQDRQLRRYTAELEESYNQTISSLAAAVDARDASTELHAERVTALAVALGRRLGIHGAELRALERGALLHDVGKIGVSDLVLLKPDSLTDEEWIQMRRHPEIGFRMLREIEFLRGALPIVRHHHEKWDGSGYPDGLIGEEIPLHARLFAVIDAYDAMTSDRPYRRGMSPTVAVARLKAGAGHHFDPAMVKAFETMLDELAGEGPIAAPQRIRATA